MPPKWDTVSGGGGGSGETNQNAFSNVAVSGQNTVAADSKTDTLNLIAGNNITITTAYYKKQAPLLAPSWPVRTWRPATSPKACSMRG